jgi:NADPH:quinone reductase-like Zn-dependent oxidoreductase
MPTSPTMRALVLERHSGPFILTEAELPTIAVGQALVRIKASGVNPLDHWRQAVAGRNSTGCSTLVANAPLKHSAG